MEGARRQRGCGTVYGSDYSDWFHRRRSWRPVVHAVRDRRKEDERSRSSCERHRHALCGPRDRRGRVSRDLDKKIERLSSGWIGTLTSFQSQTQAATERRNRLGRRRHNSRWKLDAIDFFNQELMQFLAFNNAILASINDVIIVSDL